MVVILLTKEQMKQLQKELREPIPEEVKERFRKAIEAWEKDKDKNVWRNN